MLCRGVESESTCHVRNNCTTLCHKGDSVGPLHCKGRGYRWYEQEMTSFAYGHAFITWVGEVTLMKLSSANGQEKKGKRKASDDAGPPAKQSRWNPKSFSSLHSFIPVPSVNESSVEVIEDVSSLHSFIPVPSVNESSIEVIEDVSSDDISHDFSRASSEEERIYEMSSSGKTSKADFEDKYSQFAVIGRGGFGSVYEGFRKSDSLPVAIKHISNKAVIWKQVTCNGKVHNIILEVALMLKAAGLPGLLVGKSAAVSLLDWYTLDHELILVMERPVLSKDLLRYCQSCGGSLDESDAKMILKQLVNVAIDLHSKGVFHRDIKLENVLVELDSGSPRVRIIDFGCGCFFTEESYHSNCGTHAYFPPEWFEYETYWAHPTTVWQLGILFYSLLNGHKPFTTKAYINKHIQINSALSPETKTLLSMCLARDPMERSSLEELRDHPALR